MRRPTLEHRDICEDRSGVSLRYQQGLYPVSHQGGVNKISYLVSLLQEAQRKRASRVDILLPPTRAPLLRTPAGSAAPASSTSTLTHVLQTTSVPLEQKDTPTLRDGPVVTPQPPTRLAGRYSRKITDESHLSSNRSNSESPAPSGAVRATSCNFSPKSEEDTRREAVGLDSHRAREAWCSQSGTLQARSAEDWCFQTGTFQAQILNTASDG